MHQRQRPHPTTVLCCIVGHIVVAGRQTGEPRRLPALNRLGLHHVTAVVLAICSGKCCVSVIWLLAGAAPDLGTGQLAHLLPHLLVCDIFSQGAAPLPHPEWTVVQVEHARVVKIDDLQLGLGDVLHGVRARVHSSSPGNR